MPLTLPPKPPFTLLFAFPPWAPLTSTFSEVTPAGTTNVCALPVKLKGWFTTGPKIADSAKYVVVTDGDTENGALLALVPIATPPEDTVNHWTKLPAVVARSSEGALQTAVGNAVVLVGTATGH